MKKKINEKLIDVLIERGKMNREQSVLIIDKGITVYFLFLVVAIVGLITKYLTLTNFVILICLAFVVLIITSVPYIKNLITEKRKIDEMIDMLKKSQ